VTLVAFVAWTFRVEKPPGAINAGVAEMLTVGAPTAATVTVVPAEALPPAPVADAVYVVVAEGVTVCVPPVAARLNVLPSDPLTVTLVAFDAATVRVEDAPGVMEAGAAEILTVGAGSAATITVADAEMLPPGPVALAV
jgi:hypothetical protein